MRGMAEVAESLAGDGAYRREHNAGRKGEAGGFEQCNEVASGGGAGEGDGVGIACGRSEELPQRGDGLGWDLVAIGLGDGDDGSGGGEGFGQDIAGFGGTEKENAFAVGLGSEGFGKRFGDVLWGDEIDLEADSLHCPRGGGADDGDALWLEGRVLALVEDFDGVDAGKEQPVVTFELSEGGVESGIAFGGNDLDGGYKDRSRTEGLQPGGKIG